MSFPLTDELDVVVAGVPYGFQGEFSDGRWLTDRHIARIEACSPGIRLEHPSVYDLNDGYLVERKPHAVLVECSGTEASWESLPAILFQSGFRQLLSPELRLVQSCSAGIEQIARLIPDGVTLCNASGVHAPAIAESVIAAILAQAKLLYQRRIEQRSRNWTQLPARELAGTTMCVLGTGTSARPSAAWPRRSGFTRSGFAAIRYPPRASTRRSVPTVSTIRSRAPTTSSSPAH